MRALTQRDLVEMRPLIRRWDKRSVTLEPASVAGLIAAWNAVSLVLPTLLYHAIGFRILSVALSIVAIIALFLGRRRRIADDQHRRLEQHLEARLSERMRIARELHDCLLQGFHGLMFKLQAVRELLPGRPVDAAELLDFALKAVDRAISEGRDALYNLRPTAMAGQDLVALLGTLHAELLVEQGPQSRPEYRLLVEGRPRSLHPNVRDDVYRIVREAVRNAYRHADAHHIDTEVTFGESELFIRVRDDGVGMDPRILERGWRAGHWGFPGIRERSEGLGGRLDVWSEKNGGTKIELRVAAELAYPMPPITPSTQTRRLFAALQRSAAL